MSVIKVFRAGKQHEGLWPETVSLDLKREDYIFEGDRFVRYSDYAAATQWRPIETAPKDGTKVLLFSGYITTAGWYSHQSYEGNETVWECGASLVYGPTHWMPLPNPPAA